MGSAKTQWGAALIICAAFIFTACGGSGGSGSTATGTVSLGLTDSSTSKYKAIYVTIDEVQAHKSNETSPGNSGWKTIAEPKKTYNLLSLVNGVTETLGEGKLEVGNYQQLRLIIGKKQESENNLLGLPHPHPNYIILNDGFDTVEPMKIPSGMNTGLKLIHNFMVEENQVVDLLLDFEACDSVVETGSGKYILKPTIKILQTRDKSEVYGTVTAFENPETPLSGVLVSAQISEGQSASVVRERSTLTSDDDGQEGFYSMLLSPGQTYSMVAYSDQGVYAPDCVEITVPINLDLEQNFGLEESEFGTITGSVFVDAFIPALEEDRQVVYIRFFSAVAGCSYVQVTSLSMSPLIDGTINYEIDLPLGEYDVVASSEGFVPETTTVTLATSGSTETAATLTIEELVIP